MRESDREREASEHQTAADFLRLAHHAAGFWRACATKGCQRVRACRGDVDECGAHRFPEGWAWIHGVLQALRDGARPRAAMRAADRQVIAGETVGDFGRQAGTGTFRIEYPGLGDSIEIAAVIGKRGRSPRPRIPVARQSVGRGARERAKLKPHVGRLDPPYGLGHSRGRANEAIPRRS